MTCENALTDYFSYVRGVAAPEQAAPAVLRVSWGAAAMAACCLSGYALAFPQTDSAPDGVIIGAKSLNGPDSPVEAGSWLA